MKQEKASKRTSGFYIVLYHAVYEGLRSIGTSIPNAIIPYLQKDGAIGPGQVVNNPETFDESLRKIFGFGANVIEKKILEVLYEKLQINREVGDRFSFPQEVRNVQKKLPSLKVEALPLETVNV